MANKDANGNWIQNENNTQLNIFKDTKEELKLMVIEESSKRGKRVSLREFMDDLISFYKLNHD